MRARRLCRHGHLLPVIRGQRQLRPRSFERGHPPAREVTLAAAATKLKTQRECLHLERGRLCSPHSDRRSRMRGYATEP
jgi:hypothetical protein